MTSKTTVEDFLKQYMTHGEKVEHDIEHYDGTEDRVDRHFGYRGEGVDQECGNRSHQFPRFLDYLIPVWKNILIIRNLIQIMSNYGRFIYKRLYPGSDRLAHGYGLPDDDSNQD